MSPITSLLSWGIVLIDSSSAAAYLLLTDCKDRGTLLQKNLHVQYLSSGR